MSHLESVPEEINRSEAHEQNDKVILEIQAELLRRAGCAPENNGKCEEWIATYAEAFRKIAESEPTLPELWQKDPEATLKEIADRLYMKEGEEFAA